jgi:cytochrome b pre-mRNA-processing protein 3
VDYAVSGDFSGRRMQEQVFERLWEDTTHRIRNAGVAEVSVNKQLELVQKGTFDDMFGWVVG